MPLTQNVIRLKNTLSLYRKATQALFVDGGLDERLANAINVLLYINSYTSFYAQNEQYIPEDEVDLLIGTIESFKPYDTDGNHYLKISGVLCDLVSQLIATHDLLIQLNPGNHHFLEIMQIIEQLPDTMLQTIKVPTSSA